MLTEHETAVARQARCFYARERYGTKQEGLMPHAAVAEARGAHFQERDDGIIVPISLEDGHKVWHIIQDVADWLGLWPDDYMRLLLREGERIFERARY